MIVIPMAGLSRRFTTAGYNLPKYMLPIHGSSVFAQAVGSFSSFFANTPFLFVARPVFDTGTFLIQECKALGIADARVVMLDRETAGQAETVELGLLEAAISDFEPLTIFNIDTFRQNFRFPTEGWFDRSHGYLEVFRGSGENWSYVEAQEDADEPLVSRTAEKQAISDLCCDGLYHFATSGDFRSALATERMCRSQPEEYIAPLYNHLIKRGLQIHYSLVSATRVCFCGIPAEYEAVLRRAPFL